MEVTGMVIAFFAGIFAIFKGVKWSQSSKSKQLFIIFGIVGAIVLFWNQYNAWSQKNLIEKVNATFGDINDINNAQIPILEFGSSHSGVTLLNKYGVFNAGFGDLLKLYVANNKLYVNTIIRDMDGKPIAVINENTWKLYNSNYEYNNNNEAFELVTKGERKVYFQVKLEKGIARVQGMLLNDMGKGVYVQSLPERKDGYESMMIIANGNLQKIGNLQYDIKTSTVIPLFKYPREKYLGKKRD